VKTKVPGRDPKEIQVFRQENRPALDRQQIVLLFLPWTNGITEPSGATAPSSGAGPRIWSVSDEVGFQREGQR